MKSYIFIIGIIAAIFLCISCVAAADEEQKGPAPDDCTDYAKVAETLGVTEEELKAAMKGPGDRPEMNFSDASVTLGISEESLKEVMDTKEGERMNLTESAAALGVSEEALRSALKMPEPTEGEMPEPKDGENPSFDGMGGPIKDISENLGLDINKVSEAFTAAKTC